MALTLGCAGMAASSSPGTVRTDHDEFGGNTFVVLDGMDVVAEGGVGTRQLEFNAIGQPELSTAIISVRSASERWRYLECHQLRFLADGQPVQTAEAEHNGSVIHGGVTESVSVHISAAEIARMASARTVRGKLCNDEWAFSPAQIAQLGEFHRRVATP